MDNDEVVRDAIIRKQQIIADYNGYRREMCPHVVGRKNGRVQALFLQFGGGSSSGLSDDPEDNWRCIPVEDLKNVESRDGEWHTAPNHSTKQTCVDDIEVEVEY